LAGLSLPNEASHVGGQLSKARENFDRFRATELYIASPPKGDGASILVSESLGRLARRCRSRSGHPSSPAPVGAEVCHDSSLLTGKIAGNYLKIAGFMVRRVRIIGNFK
jgi:hypothetical protein